ncbi:MAG: ABC transporter ATP-binding protein [Verrucomicrobiota bacterium]
MNLNEEVKALELPDYKDKTPEMKQRFEELKQRPVILDIQSLGREFCAGDKTTVALQDVNLQLYRREFHMIVGPSGCGKSTLIRIIAGLDYPTSGEALLDGNPVLGPGSDRGMVFQGYTLFPWLTVKKNVMFGLEIKQGRSTSVESEAMEWIDLVGLAKFANHYPCQLSGGMKQRVAIARALANQPRILIMDEPFAALDAQTRAQMQSHLLQIWREVDVTILFITHDLDEATYLGDRITILDSHPGRVREIIEVGVPRPRNPDQFLSPLFLSIKKRLEHLIHPEKPEGENGLPIVKMTRVGDEVE